MDEGSTSERTTEYAAFTHCTNWKPVIAAVHGYCLGHTLGTALYCDHLVAANDAVFEVTEIKLGLPTAHFIPRLGRAAFATEVAMTGRRFTAVEAYDAGIVTRLVEERAHLRRPRSWRGNCSRTRSGHCARTCGCAARSWPRSRRGTRRCRRASTGPTTPRRRLRWRSSRAATAKKSLKSTPRDAGPSSVGKERRRRPRHGAAHWQGRYRFGGATAWRECELVDVSATGAGFQAFMLATDALPMADLELELVDRGDPAPDPLRLVGRVRHLTRSNAGHVRVGHGVRRAERVRGTPARDAVPS